MGSIVVDVMLKSEILDPQGQAVRGALPRLGFAGFTDVRQGKRFVLTVDGEVTAEHLAAAREAAERLLSNPVIENVVSVRAEDASPADPADAEASDALRAHAEEPAEGADENEGDEQADENEGEADEQPDGQADENEGEGEQ